MRPVVVANFDAEIEMARDRMPGPHPALPKAIGERLAAVAPTLSILAEGAEVVATASDVPGDATAVLGWAETRSVAAARRRCEPPAPLWEAIGAPEIVARVNDRRFWLEHARRHGWVLPETVEIRSVEALRERLPALAAASADGGWSVKAPLSAAGRERVHRWGAEMPGDIETRVRRLLDRFGVLIAEPWMPRVVDYGVAGVIARDRTEIFAPHRLVIESGTFQSVVIDDRQGAPAPLIRAAEQAAAALREAGYLGAFGIDGFTYATPGGGEAVCAACEINARLTFGLIARLHQRAANSPMPFAWQPPAADV